MARIIWVMLTRSIRSWLAVQTRPHETDLLLVHQQLSLRFSLFYVTTYDLRIGESLSQSFAMVPAHVI